MSSSLLFSAKCAAGSRHAVHRAQCVGCKMNSYQPREGQTYCLLCPNGTISDGSNATKCTSKYGSVSLRCNRRPASEALTQTCPVMHTNENSFPHDKHRQLSLKSQQNLHKIKSLKQNDKRHYTKLLLN